LIFFQKFFYNSNMILLKWIKNNSQLFKQKMLLRKIDPNVINEFFEIYNKWLNLDTHLNQLRHDKNQNSSKDNYEYSKNLKIEIQKYTKEFNDLNEKLQELMIAFPNILDD